MGEFRISAMYRQDVATIGAAVTDCIHAMFWKLPLFVVVECNPYVF